MEDAPYNEQTIMVRDGYFYGLGLAIAAMLLKYVTGNVWAAIPALILAAFFLWFFRDPQRAVPDDPGLVVSPADGKVTAIDHIQGLRGRQIRLSIFLNVFNVHVNRAPIAGKIADINYIKGKYLNAMNAASADQNEQNRVVIDDGHCQVAFRQIAGLLARRIVFNKRLGDRVERGERVGLIKFGSRVDVLMPGDAEVLVKLGETVQGGASVLAVLASREEPELIGASAEKMI